MKMKLIRDLDKHVVVGQQCLCSVTAYKSPNLISSARRECIGPGYEDRSPGSGLNWQNEKSIIGCIRKIYDAILIFFGFECIILIKFQGNIYVIFQ